MNTRIYGILKSVRAPYRYAGGEVGSAKHRWDNAKSKICLVFPDSYEIGMSHIGLSILYHAVNGRDGFLAERAFAPWGDMEFALRENGISVFSNESHRPIADFDAIGFSLAYELTYTNVLNILSLGGIPLRSRDRGEDYPIVIAGGPCAYNPMPVSAFFDAIVIGDGEDAIMEIMDAIAKRRKRGQSRADLLWALSRIEGVFVPSIGVHEVGINQRRVSDLNLAPYPRRPITPYAAVQMRLPIEVARGCVRGCRFCQAGYIYRPIRQRRADIAVDIAVDAAKSTGLEDISFLSLSIGDWPPLENAVKAVLDKCSDAFVNISLPSLRAEALSSEFLSALGSSRHGGFTLAPEAATERMRVFINKGNTDRDLLKSVEAVFSGGWRAVKLYFMVGLPGETEEEIDGIIKLANACLDVGRRYHSRPEVTVSTSVFIPKAHTPFQWDAQISIDSAKRIQSELKRRLKRRGLYYRWHNVYQSMLEGVFSRGGYELADVIETAWRIGARFDAWDECFDFNVWLKAFEKCNIDAYSYLNGRSLDFKFPWDELKVGPLRDFLMKERQCADELQKTDVCTSLCTNCGVCDFDKIKNDVAKNFLHMPHIEDEEVKRLPEVIYRYRFKYQKTDRSVFLGQLETTDAMRFAVRSAGLPLAYSKGFHPRVRVSMGPALPVGVESVAEYADMAFTHEMKPEDVMVAMANRLPDGMKITNVIRLSDGADSISDAIKSFAYEISFERTKCDIASFVNRFNSIASFMVDRIRKGKTKRVDLKEIVVRLALIEHHMIGMDVLNAKQGLRLSEILMSVFELTKDEFNELFIKKVSVRWLTN